MERSQLPYTRAMLLRPILLALAAACVASTADAQPTEPTRRVEVHVTVTTNGAPFPAGTYISMGVAEDIYVPDVPTDASGKAVLAADIPAGIGTVLIEVPDILAWGPDDQIRAKNEAAMLAGRTFSLPPAKLISLVPGQQVYHIEFFAPEAVTVKGRTVDLTGKPLPVSAHRGGLFNTRFCLESDRGYFEVIGVPKAQDSFLFLGTNHPETAVTWLAAAQTSANVELGNVEIPVGATDAVIEVAVTGREAVREDLGLQRSCITLVREDGVAVYTFDVNDQGGITHSPPFAYPGPTAVRAGRYYIVPGMEVTSDSSLKVLRLIRAGKHALLDAAGVPVIEPVTGQTTSSAIDLAAVQRIIDELPEPK